MEEELEEPTLPVAGDVCLALMDRYGRSSAAHHRHLCATAAAMRSLLEEEQLPLTPPSYFAAAIDSLIHNYSELDAVSISALSAFLSVLLPSLPARSLPPGRASDAAFALIGFLRVPPENLMCSALVRSMVGSLGFLISCIDSEDWVAIRRGFNLLLEFAVDKRPKVRRCAQVCIEKNLKYFEKSVIKEKASKAVLSSFNGCLHLACDMNALVIENGSASKGVTCPEHLEVLHMLSAVKALVPVLSRKVIKKILSTVCMFLGPRFSMITRHIHSLIEVIFEHSGNENISSEADEIVHNLSSYVTSIEKKPIDTVMSAMTLLKSALDKLHALDPSTWSKNLPLVFNHIAGFLNSEANISSHAANILKEIISCHIERSTFLVSGIQLLNDNINNSEANSLISICSGLENMLGAWNIIPNEHTLAVISDLFLKLGECAHLFMKGIVLKLSKWAEDLNDDVPGKEHLQKCIGSAVIALGPEKMFLLLPITLHSENLTCSNSWLIPILKKYVIGASLNFFIEHVVPLAKSLKKACSEAKKSPKLLELQSSVQGLWGLLPAFCNYTTDTSKSIKSVVSCLIAMFSDDPSTHEMISIALQVLVNQNRGVIMAKQKSEDVVEDCNTKPQAAPSYYSTKIASKNLHALSLNSMDVIQILTEVFFKSPPAKRAYLKETIGCMASIAQKSDTRQFFVSLLENFEPDNIVAEASENHMEKGADEEQDGEITANGHGVAQRSMMIELASCFVEGASEEFINMIFDYIKSSLVDDGLCQFEAYFTLSRIFKEHVWFFHSRFDELRVLLFGAKKPADIMTLRMRLSCYHFLLVHLLKSHEKKMSKKAFLVLNEIIVTLKDSNEEVRKSAYDILIIVSGNLKNSMLSNPEQPLQRFFTMIMGYLSGSSPHITSGAVSALSLLIYKNTGVWFSVPELVPSVLALLQSKANEVIKAVLGFAKVLVSCLHAQDLQNFLSAIVNAILPWSSVSKNHFRSKVKIILEIMIRKCGLSSVDLVTPEKYKGFVKSVVEQHQTISKEAVKHEVGKKQEDASTSKKRKRRESIGSMAVNHPQTSENPKRGRRQNIYRGEISRRTKDPEYDSGKGRKSKWTANKDENRRGAYKKPGRVGKEMNTSRNRGTKKFFKPGPASRSAEASSKFQKQKKVGKHMK